ncbi:unnamed protein product [Closterium sp. NIES-53]
MQLQQRPRESLPPQQLREWYASRSGGSAGVAVAQLREWYAQRGASRSSARYPYVIRTGDRAGQNCGTMGHTQSRCFSCLSDTWCAEFGDAAELPCWLELLRQGVDVFGLDYDAILTAMYALTIGTEGDCSLCVLPDPGIEVAALSASESALPSTAPAEALHTFTLDSGASRCFIRESTTLTPLPAPVPVRLADPSRGQVVARSSTVLLCLAVPFGSLFGLHLPSFSTNLTLLWHHRLGHPSLPRLRGMHSRLLVSGLPRSLPPLPPSPAPPCLPCVEGRQRAAPHSSSFPPTTAPLQTLHIGVWGPARGQVVDVLIPWIRVVCLQLRERFHRDLPVLRLHSDRGGEFSSDLLRDFCRREGIFQSFTLPNSPQQNGRAERRIGLVMEVARTSMIHAAAPHFLWPFAVWYAAHQLNLWPRVSLSETSPTLSWTGEVDESVPFYRLFPYRSAAPPPPSLFLAPGPPPVDPLPPQGPSPSGVSQVDPLPGELGAARGAAFGGAEPGGTGSEGAESGDAEPGGAELGGAEPAGVEPGGAQPKGVELRGAESEGAKNGGAQSRGSTGAGGAGVTGGAGGTGVTAAAGPGGACTRGTGAAGTVGVGGARAGGARAEGTSAGGARAGGAGLLILELEVLALGVLVVLV